jgi:hypothetical protein
MGVYQIVKNSSDINLYSQGWWTFAAGPSQNFCSTDCQDNGAIYQGNSRFFAYGVDTINVHNLVIELSPDGKSLTPIVTHEANQGNIHDIFLTAVVAAYLRQSS